jgi:hypothetical protein
MHKYGISVLDREMIQIIEELKHGTHIKPNDEGYLIDTQNSIFYYYAEYKSGKWSGTDNKTTFKGKEYNLKKKGNHRTFRK